ncbi:MAG: 16S rRNA (guanine(966)-N(2))-methyltransferase RsmD [Chloroflexi bacterium]|nr:16S rRNA (guanine(966)-N(2))-methyltransferase RsmD [Chloroflexota bacterium]
MRVITGTAKGRQLVAPKGLSVRPTTDKVREAIFSMVVADGMRRSEEWQETGGFPFRRVLDLYAGTGALGIEALSRGSEHADFVESSQRACAAIRTNLQRTGLGDRAAIHTGRVETVVSTFRSPYDLILLDPPYNDPDTLVVLEAIGSSALVTEGTLVVLEHGRPLAVPADAGTLHLARTRFHGTTAVSLYAC